MRSFLLGTVVLLAGIGLLTFTFRHFSHTDTSTAPNTEVTIPTTTTASTTNPLLASSTTVHVPIAVYHSIRDTSPEETLEVRRYTIPPAIFDEQMRYLQENGFHTITFAMLYEAVTYGTPLPSKPVVLSFDDGWATQYTEALPILKKYNLTATFFLYPNVIEHENYMTWDEAHALRDAGMEIGSHSKSHQYMTKQETEDQLYEVTRSKEILEEKLGTEIKTFAYPFGVYNTDLQAMLQDAGYTTARGLETGVTHNTDNLYNLSSYLIRRDFEDFKYFVNQTQ